MNLNKSQWNKFRITKTKKMVIKNMGGIQLIHFLSPFTCWITPSESKCRELRYVGVLFGSSDDHREDCPKLFWYIFAISGPFADFLFKRWSFPTGPWKVLIQNQWLRFWMYMYAKIRYNWKLPKRLSRDHTFDIIRFHFQSSHFKMFLD